MTETTTGLNRSLVEAEQPTDPTSQTAAWLCLEDAHRTMQQLEVRFEEWFHNMDVLDQFTSPVEDLLHAMSTAPDPFLVGMLYGMLSFRMQIDQSAQAQ